MKQTEFKSTIENQFDYICKKAMEGELKDYKKSIARRLKHEVTLSDIELLTNNLSTYDVHSCDFNIVCTENMQAQIKNDLLGEAIINLSERKREILILYYFMDMDDTQIGKYLKINRSTVYRHRLSALKLIKNYMEVASEKKIFHD